jgi:hypothetical protein
VADMLCAECQSFERRGYIGNWRVQSDAPALNWWRIRVTGGFEQPLGENLQASDVEIETEFALLKRHCNGIALSV